MPQSVPIPQLTVPSDCQHHWSFAAVALITEGPACKSLPDVLEHTELPQRSKMPVEQANQVAARQTTPRTVSILHSHEVHRLWLPQSSKDTEVVGSCGTRSIAEQRLGITWQPLRLQAHSNIHMLLPQDSLMLGTLPCLKP
jgi:hypothetical protein